MAQGHPEIALALLVHDDTEPFQFVSASNREPLCHQAWNQQARKLADPGRFDEAMGFTCQSAPCKAIAPELVEAIRAETTRSHLKFAHNACQKGDYNQALGKFEHM